MRELFGKSVFVDYYKPKEFKAKEKVEEMGVAFKQMFHGLMMTAMAQTQGMVDFNPNQQRGRSGRGGRSRGGHSGYGMGNNPRSNYGGSSGAYQGHAPNNSTYGQPPHANNAKPNQYNSYAFGSNVSNPPLPGSGTSSAAPLGTPVGVPPMGSNISGGVASAASLNGVYQPTGVLPSGGLSGSLPTGPPIGGMPMGSTPPTLPPTKGQDSKVINVADLQGMDEEDKKTHFGEVIYPIIEEKYGDDAPKITGMIIDLEDDNLLAVMNSRNTLMEKAHEGYVLLRESEGAES